MVKRQELSRIRICHAVSQCAENAALRVVKGHRADARHAVAHPCAEAVITAFVLLRRCAQLQRAAAALDGQSRSVRAVFCQKLTKFFDRIKLLSTDSGDHVALFQPASLCRAFSIGKADDEHAVRKELHADDLSHGDQLADRPFRRLCRRQHERGGGKKSQQDRRRALSDAMRSIHSLTPSKNESGRRVLCAQESSRPLTPAFFCLFLSFFVRRIYFLRFGQN